MKDVTNPVRLPSLCCTSYLPLLLDSTQQVFIFHWLIQLISILLQHRISETFTILFYHRFSHRHLNKRKQEGILHKVHPRTGHEGPKGEQRYRSTLSLISAPDGMGSQRHSPTVLHPGERTGTQCIGGWVDPRADLDECEKSRPHRDFFKLQLYWSFSTQIQWLHGRYFSNALLTDYCPCVSNCIVRLLM